MNNPSPPYKGFMMFRQTPPAPPFGWTESLWVNNPSFDASLTALEEIADRRLMMLPKGVVIERMKVTNPRFLRACVDSSLTNLKGKYDFDYRTAWTVLLLRFQGNGFSTNYNLGGVPKDIANITGIHPTEQWQAGFDRFVETIKRHCVMVNERQKEKVQIQGITQTASGQVKISMAVDFFDAAHVQIKNGCFARIRLSGVIQQRSLNGTHSVQILDTKNAVTTKQIAILPNLTGGFVTTMAAKTINPIESVTLTRVSSRKRGYGHSYPRRGRARNRRRG